MWISSKVFDWFRISQSSFDDLRQELAAAKAERDTLRSEVTAARITNDWFRVKINQLEVQNAALLERAYNIHVPAPEIARQPSLDPSWDPRLHSFEDVGDELALRLGYPTYGLPSSS